MLTIDEIRRIKDTRKVNLTMHAQEKMIERGIEIDDILNGIDQGEIIEQYPDATPFPACLIMAVLYTDYVLHICLSISDSEIFIITAYNPNLDKWESDYITRRK